MKREQEQMGLPILLFPGFLSPKSPPPSPYDNGQLEVTTVARDRSVWKELIPRPIIPYARRRNREGDEPDEIRVQTFYIVIFNFTFTYEVVVSIFLSSLHISCSVKRRGVGLNLGGARFVIL